MTAPTAAPLTLLDLLTDQPQTGEKLGQQLGVGRVTVNTWAKKLQEEGVPLEISRLGYALEAGTPAPKLVQVRGPLGAALRYVGTVGSTQDEARAWANAPHCAAPHGAVVVAERQTAGRGRRGRSWETMQGTLAFSVLLRPEAAPEALSLARLPVLPLAAGVALQAACTALDVPCGLKWPNDLLTPTRQKLAGILLEADLRGEEARQVVLGIGINVSDAPPGAAHLSQFAPALTRAEVLAKILDSLSYWLTQPSNDILKAWKAHNLVLGQQVTVKTATGELGGLATGLDAQGSLLLQTTEGKEITVSAGDVALVEAFGERTEQELRG